MARRIAGYSGFLLVVVVAGRDVTAERFIWNRERRLGPYPMQVTMPIYGIALSTPD